MLITHCPGTLTTATRQTFERIRHWLYGEATRARRRLVVGVGGPGGCGKSTLSWWLRHHLPEARVLALDDFRVPRSERPAHGRFGSHPEANDLLGLRQCLARFRTEGAVRQPVFDPEAGSPTRNVEAEGVGVLIADGEIAAHDGLRREWDFLILVQAHWRTQLATRLSRDRKRYSRSLEKAIDLFLHSNLRDYPAFAEGAVEEAHVIVYRDSRKNYSIRRMPVEVNP